VVKDHIFTFLIIARKISCRCFKAPKIIDTRGVIVAEKEDWCERRREDIVKVGRSDARLLESRVEEWLKSQTEKRGGMYLKFTSPGNIGVPDRIILRDGKVYFVELKQEHGRLSPIQKAQISRMQECGATVFVVYGKAGAEKLVADLFGPTPKTTDGFGIEEWR